MIKKKLKTISSFLALTLIFSLSSMKTKEAEAYNVGGDGMIN